MVGAAKQSLPDAASDFFEIIIYVIALYRDLKNNIMHN